LLLLLLNSSLLKKYKKYNNNNNNDTENKEIKRIGKVVCLFPIFFFPKLSEIFRIPHSTTIKAQVSKFAFFSQLNKLATLLCSEPPSIFATLHLKRGSQRSNGWVQGG